MTAPVRRPPGRLVYLGTPAMSVPPLRALHEAGCSVELVVTNPDRRRGRGSQTSPSPVKTAAQQLGIPVSHDVDDVLGVGADLGVVVAFGQIIRPHVLQALDMVNLHFSLLPRWRGAAPVERAILAGDAETGVDLMVVEEGLDAGPVLARAVVEIGPDESADELRGRLVDLGSDLLVTHLTTGLPEPTPQRGEAVYAHKLTPEDLHIDWNAAADPPTGTRARGHDGERFKIWRTRVDPTGEGVLHPTGDGWIELVEVQPAGKARMEASAWARGAHWSPGDRLGT